MSPTTPRTLAQKVWDRHVVHSAAGEPDLLYIDLHLVHEVTSPQAFDGLRMSGRKVRRPDLTVATEDHNVPTANIDQPIADPISARQVEVLRENTAEFGVTNFPMGDPLQGIVHVIAPEQGRTLPGMTVVCGDSHTATHGAFGALAFGIGTSEVEHVLATQTLPQSRPKWMAVTVEGQAPADVTAKDIVLAIIGRIGTGGGIGHVIEYRGSAIRALSMEERMTICNMSIEAGAKAGLVAPDDTTFEYLKGRANAPKGEQWAAAVADWRVANAGEQKIKKTGAGAPHMALVENPDILSTVAHLKSKRPPLVIGFAAETEKVVEHAKAKLARKGCDWILANDVSPESGVMGGDINTIHLVSKDGVENWPPQSKDEVASMLIRRIAAAIGESK